MSTHLGCFFMDEIFMPLPDKSALIGANVTEQGFKTALGDFIDNASSKEDVSTAKQEAVQEAATEADVIASEKLNQAKEFSKQNQNALLNAVDASTVIFGRKSALVSSSTVLSTSHVIFKKQLQKQQIISQIEVQCSQDATLFIATAKKVGATYVKQKEIQVSLKKGRNLLNITEKLVANINDFLVFHSSVSAIEYTLDASDENYVVANTATNNVLSNIIDPVQQAQIQIKITTTDFYSLSDITTEQNTLKTQSVYFEKALSKIADYDSSRIGKSGSFSSGTTLNPVPVIFAKAVEKTGVISLLEFYATNAGELKFGSVKRKDASSFEVVQQNTVQMTVGVNRIDVTHLNIEAKAGDFLFFKSSVSSVTAVTETVEDAAAYYAANTSTETLFSNLIGPLKAARLQFGFIVESLEIKVPMLEILTQAQFDALEVKDANTLYGVTS